eukprot:g16678.t1
MTLVFSRYAKAGSTAQDVDGAAAGAGSAAGPLFPTKVMNQAMARLRAFEQLSRHKTKSRSSLSLSLPALPPAPPITAFSSAEDVGASLPDMPSLRISSGEQSGGPDNPENDFVFESLLSNQQAQSDETADMLHSHRVMLAGVARLVRALAYLLEYVEHLQANIVKNPNSTGEDVKHARVQLRLLLDFQRALLEKANALQLTTAFKFFFRPDVAQGYIASERKTSGAPTPLFSENYPRAFEFEKLPGVFTGDWVDVSLPVVLEAAESGIASIDDDAGGVVAESKEGTVAAKETTGAAGSETLFAEFLRGQAEGKQRQEELTGDKEPEHVPKAMTRDFVEAEKLSKFLFSETDVVRFPEERWREGDDPFLETGEYDSNGSTVVSEGEDDDEDSGGVATTRQMMTGTSAYPSEGGAAAKAVQRAVSFQSGSGEGNSGGANLFYSYVEGRVEDTGNADEDETFSSPVSSCSSLDYPPGRSLSGSPDASRDEGDRGAELDFVPEQNEGTVAGHDRISLCGRPSFLFYAEAEHGLDMDSGASSSRSSRSSALGGSPEELSRSFVEFDTRSASWEAEEHDGRDAFSSSFNLEGGGGSVVVSDESDFYFSTRNYAQWSQHISLDGERAVAPNSAGNFYSSMLATTSSWRRSASVLSDRGGTSCSLLSISSFASTPRDVDVDVDRAAASRRPFLFMADSDHNGKKLNRHLPATTTFLYGLLVASINSKEYANFGVSGWEQSSVDTGVLSDESLSGKEKVRRLFGVEFEWREFPFVTVAKVESSNADGTKTRAASGNIAEGDMLLLLNGDRITTVSQMGELCSSPDEAVCKLVGNKIAGGKKGQFLFFRKKYHNTLAQLGVEESGLKLGVQHDGSGKVTVVEEHGWAAKNRLQVGDRILFIDADFVFRKPEKMDKFAEEDLKPGTQILVKRNPPGFPEDIYARESNVGRPLPRPWRAAAPATVSSSSMSSDRKMLNKSLTATPTFHYALLAASISSKEYANFGISGWEQSSVDTAVVQDTSRSPTEKVLTLFGVEFDWSQFPFVTVSKLQATNPADGSKTRAASSGIVEGDMLLLLNGERITTVGQMADLCKSGPDEAVLSLVEKRISGGKKAQFLFFRKKYQTTLVQVGVTESGLKLGVQHDGSGKLTEVAEGGFASRTGLAVGDRIVISSKEYANFGISGWEQSSVDTAVLQDTSLSPTEKVLTLLGVEFDWSQFPFVTVSKLQATNPSDGSKTRAASSGIVEGDMLLLLNGERITTIGQMADLCKSGPDEAVLSLVEKRISGGKNKAQFLKRHGPPTPTFLYGILAASLSSKEYANFGISGWEQGSLDTGVASDSGLPGPEKMLKLFGISLDWRRFPIVVVSKIQPTHADGTTSRAASGNISQGDMLVLLNGERITTLAQMGDMGKSPDDVVVELVTKRIAEQKRAQLVFFRKKYHATLVQLGVAEGASRKFGIETDGTGKVTKVVGDRDTSWAAANKLTAGDRILLVENDFVFKKPEKLTPMLEDGFELKTGTQILIQRKPPGFGDDVRDLESYITRPLPKKWRDVVGEAEPPEAPAGAPAPPSRTNLQIVPTANQPSTTQFLYGILAASVPATSYAEFGMTGWEQRSWDDKVLADEGLNAKQKISKLFGMSLDFNDFPVVRARDIVRTQPDPKSGETVKTRAAAGGIVEGDMLLLLNGNRVTTIAQVEGVESPHAAVLQLCKERIAGEKKVGFLFFRKKYQETIVQLPVVGGDTPLGVVAMDKEKITEVGASTTTSGGNSNSSSFAARYQLQSGDQIVFIDADFVFKKPEKAEKFLGAQPAELLKDGTQVLLRRRGKGTSATPGNETAYAGFPADLFEGESNFRRKMSSAWEKAIDRKAQKRPAVVSPSSGSKIVSAKNFRAVAEQAPAVDLDAIAAAAAATASQAQHDDKQVIFVRKKLKPREDAAAAMLREERRKRRAQAKRSGSRLIDLQQDEMAEQHKKRRRLQKRYLERNETPAIRGIGGRESKLLDDAAALFGSFEGGNRLLGAAMSALSAEDDAAAGGGGETSRSNRPPLRDPLDVDDQGTVLQEAGGDPEPVRVVPYLLAEECAFLCAFLEWLELIRQGPKFGFDARSLMGAMGDGGGSGNFLAGGIGFALAMFGEGAPEPPAFDDSHGVGNGSAQAKFHALAKLSDSALEKHLQAAMVEETSKLEDHVEYLRRLALRKYERLLAIRDKYLQTLSITCRNRIAYEFGLDNDSHFFCESTEVLLHQTEIRVCNARELVRKEGGQGEGSAFGFGLQLTRLGPDGTIIDKVQKRRLYIKQKWKHLWRRVCLVLHVTKSFSSLLPVYGKRGLNYRMKQLAGLLVKSRGAVEDFAVGVVSEMMHRQQ